MSIMDADKYIDRIALLRDTAETLKGENVTPIYRDFVLRGKRAEMTEGQAFDAAEEWLNSRDAVREAVAALRGARAGLLRRATAAEKTPEVIQAIMDCYPYEALFRNAY